MQIRNKLTLLSSAALLALIPAVTVVAQSTAAVSDHALSGYPYVTPGQEDGYQSPATSASAGISYVGVGYSDQLITNPITLAAVPNFDFGYHKKTETKDSFSLIDGATKRYLVVVDKNGTLDWNVTAALGANIKTPTLINNNDVSIVSNTTNKPVIKSGSSPDTDWDGSKITSTLGSSPNSNLSNPSFTLSNNSSQTVFGYTGIKSPTPAMASPLTAVLDFNAPDSVTFNYNNTKQPVVADKFVAPITWTLSVTA
ncbi:hypothetical protein [Bombilactobacillus bombi]|uniref:hypothetical protein n=1 Tax=Bombilactobacillus bombi TaxID=1303590 RepID=UPI0015E5A4CF|nr:hypothetical protein [Bombilactobacillus bombi]MBA1434446.1 hypothetical protein [Bombilactobacillus bombi]